jgi:hypothetical protein
MTINSAIYKTNIPCEIRKFLYNSKPAVAIAIKNDINDLPGIVIGQSKFSGKNYNVEAVIEAIKETYDEK